MEPKVSVIIPIYNVERYISECLDSIINQTLKDIEIICVNDASRDGSLAILKEYAGKDERIKVVNKTKNEGVSCARNAGIEQAKGKYVYFCDSDDMLATYALEMLYDVSEEKQLDVLLFDGQSFFEEEELEGKFKEFKSLYHRSKEYNQVTTGINLLMQMLNSRDYRVNVYLAFYNREWLVKQQLVFMSNILHEDNLFTFECMLKSNKIVHISEALYFRRIHKNSIMTRPQSFEHCYGYFVCGFEMLKSMYLLTYLLTYLL